MKLLNQTVEALQRFPECLFALAVDTLPDAGGEVGYIPVNDRNGMPRHR